MDDERRHERAGWRRSRATSIAWSMMNWVHDLLQTPAHTLTPDKTPELTPVHWRCWM